MCPTANLRLPRLSSLSTRLYVHSCGQVVGGDDMREVMGLRTLGALGLGVHKDARGDGQGRTCTCRTAARQRALACLDGPPNALTVGVGQHCGRGRSEGEGESATPNALAGHSESGKGKSLQRARVRRKPTPPAYTSSGVYSTCACGHKRMHSWGGVGQQQQGTACCAAQASAHLLVEQ